MVQATKVSEYRTFTLRVSEQPTFQTPVGCWRSSCTPVQSLGDVATGLMSCLSDCYKVPQELAANQSKSHKEFNAQARGHESEGCGFESQHWRNTFF